MCDLIAAEDVESYRALPGQLVELVERGPDAGPSAPERVQDLGDFALPTGKK